MPDPFEITEEEFEAAKAHLLEQHGAIPPSLQRVIDRGGRFRRETPVTADGPPLPIVLCEFETAIPRMYEDDPEE